ncbi:hypothetical protein G6011_05944 [Alternaria panax]|uniref:Uncharacterized protein n=1 Tax=Alternaria panax TaxID=48097 RepID=A0AAD4FI03_9PLEO|nr:hypothetical protein G6011_05944 [Alternaria panax]
MSTPTKDKNPTLSRKILKDEHIVFHDHVHESHELPEWLRSTYLRMRDVRAKAPRGSRKGIEAELKEFQKSGQDGKTAVELGWSLEPILGGKGYMARESFGKQSTPAETEMEISLRDCLRVKKRAIGLRKGKLPEPHWVLLLLAEFFKTYRQVHGTENEHRDLFRRWELHVDVLWNECLSRKDFMNTLRTEPKPDIAYLFPIIDTASNIPIEYRFDSKVENFTLPVLSELRKRGGVIPSPKTGLLSCDSTRPESLGASDLACFPWSIVEVKPSTENDRTAEFCYCQAANGSAKALIMRERLADMIPEPNNKALVIFSFTCVGPSVRLWLTFRDPDSRNIEMCCILATSLELTWGVFLLRIVIENMHEWVYEEVKPEICRWISYVRSHPKRPTITTPNGDRIEPRDRRARSEAPPPDDRTTVSSSGLPKPKGTRTISRGNTVPICANSPSPLYQQSVQLSSPPKPASRSKSNSKSSKEMTQPRRAHSPTSSSRSVARSTTSSDNSALASPSVPSRPASCSKLTSTSSKFTSTSSKKKAPPRDAESPSARSRRRSTRQSTLSSAVEEDRDDEDEDNLKNYACDAADDDYEPSDGGSDNEADEVYLSSYGGKSLKLKGRSRKSNVF